MFFIADCEKHITFSHATTQNKRDTIPLPLQKPYNLLAPTRAQHDAHLKEFHVTQWGYLSPKLILGAVLNLVPLMHCVRIYPQIKTLLVEMTIPGKLGASPGQE